MTPKLVVATILGSFLASTWATTLLLTTGWIPKWAEFPVITTAAILWIGTSLWFLDKTE